MVTICAIAFFVSISIVLKSRGENSLTGSGLPQVFSKSTPTPTVIPAPPNAPKTFNFDSSTDLKAELEKINPQILDSDFE